jgi:hypothetical protein
MKKVVLFIICAFALSSCFNNKKETKDVQQTTSVTTDDSSVIRQLLILDSIPNAYGEDSKLLLKTVVNNLTVVDNHLAFAITKDSFVNIGLPEHYYDRLVKDIKDANQMIDSTGIKNMDEILKKSYKDLYELFGEPEKKH